MYYFADPRLVQLEAVDGKALHAVLHRDVRRYELRAFGLRGRAVQQHDEGLPYLL